MSLPPRVLCVDDNKVLCETLAAVMTNGPNPLRMEFAHDGEAAMDSLLDESTSEDPYRLLILDVRVPKVEGDSVDERLGINLLYGLLEQQNSLSLLPAGTPIVVYTAFPTYLDCVECVRRGAADYIPKTDLDTDANNVELLDRRCRELAYPVQPAPSEVKIWLDKNRDKLVREYGGGFVGLVRRDLDVELPIVGDFAVLKGETYGEVRHRILSDRVLRWEKPSIINIPERLGVV